MRRTLVLYIVLLALPSEAHAHGQETVVFAAGNIASLVIIGVWALLTKEPRRTKWIGIGLSVASVFVMDGLIPPRFFFEHPALMLAASILVPLVCGLLPSAMARRSGNLKD